MGTVVSGLRDRKDVPIGMSRIVSTGVRSSQERKCLKVGRGIRREAKYRLAGKCPLSLLFMLGEKLFGESM